MKALKIFINTLVITFFVILSGCSDSVVSPSDTASNESQIANSVSDSKFLTSNQNKIIIPEKNRKSILFNSKIILRPGETVFLNSKVTSLSWITAYTVSNCNFDRRELFISSSSLDRNGSLECSWKSDNSFKIEDLSIQNVSNQTKIIDINLAGY